MMKIKSKLLNSISILALGALISCGGSKENTSDESAEFDVAKEELKQTLEDVTYKIPSPTEVPFLIEATGAEYNSNFINARESVETYLSTFSKAAINLGVYASDVAYLSSYGKTQESINYLETMKKLADHLGVVSAIDESVLTRFESSIDKKDSLEYLINETVENVDSYLRNEQRTKVAALVTAGGFIEGLYISTALVNTYPKDLLPEDVRNIILTPIIKIILDQKLAISEVIKLLESVGQDDETSSLLVEFKELQATYEKLNMEDQIKNNRADLMLSDETLKTISEKVKKIRAGMIA